MSVDIYEPPHKARRAYEPTLQAVKTGRPRSDVAKIVKIILISILLLQNSIIISTFVFRFGACSLAVGASEKGIG